MKALPKPAAGAASSPGRAADKYPPPLMTRFFRSRSTRGRRPSRGTLSPLFYLRSSTRRLTTITDIAQEPEPSSPKVTCIGQVRVRRRRAGKCKGRGRRRRGWMRRVVICGKFFKRLRREFRKWGLGFRCGDCRRVDDERAGSVTREFSEKNVGKNAGNVCSGKFTNTWRGNGDDRIEQTRRDEDDSVSSPKNALMLARCRSAPYRSSSLGGQLLWGEHGKNDNDGDDEVEIRAESDGILKRPTFETRINQEISRELKRERAVLTRSKSEPARRGDRLVQSTAHIQHCPKHSS